MIPLEDFFRKPDKLMLRLSPSGEHLFELLLEVLEIVLVNGLRKLFAQ